MTAAWLREPQPDLAAERILDAADKAFVELGVSAAGMGKVAEYAGCSRGTLYRYFPNRHALHVAYVDREARRINARVRDAIAEIEDPRARLVESIVLSLREVRGSPGTAAWFAPGISDLAARMSRSSEVVDRMTRGFVAGLFAADGSDSEDRLRARWMVRVIVSLLALPGTDEAEERALVERFVAPVLVSHPS